MKNKTKCFAVATAVLLAFCLVFIMPVAADTQITFNEVSTFDELQNNLTAGNSVKLVKDISVTNTLTIPAGKVVTIDLNGHTISQEAECTKDYQNMIANKGSLTIVGNGKISFTDTSIGDPNFGWGSYTIHNTGTLVVGDETSSDLTIELQRTQSSSHCSMAIFQYSGSTTINNGNIINPSYIALRLWDGEMTINDGNIYGGKRAIWIQLAGNCYNTAPSITLKITGGTLKTDGYTSDGYEYKQVIYSYTYGNSFKNTNIIIEGGTFDGDVALSGGLANYKKTDTHNCLDLESCLKNVNARALETVTVSGGTFNGDIYSYGVNEPENKKQAMGPFITGGTFGEDPSEYVNTETYEAVLSGGKYVVAKKGSLNAAISAADIGFDSVKVGYTQPAEKIVTIKNDGQRDVTLNLPTSEKYDIALSANTLKSGETVDLTIQPKENLPVGNYAETITVTTNEGAETTFKVSFLVYQPSSGGSSKPVEEPVEPEIPEEPEVPTEEPVAGEATVETEVTDGGEVEFEAPVEEPEAGEVGTPAAD